jgi:hypothetical protein
MFLLFSTTCELFFQIFLGHFCDHWGRLPNKCGFSLNWTFFAIQKFDPRGNQLTGPVRLLRRIAIQIQKMRFKNLGIRLKQKLKFLYVR